MCTALHTLFVCIALLTFSYTSKCVLHHRLFHTQVNVYCITRFIVPSKLRVFHKKVVVCNCILQYVVETICTI